MKIFSFYILTLCSFSIIAQAEKVESKSYNGMLKMLLKSDVPEITVDEAAKKDTAIFVDTRELDEFKVSHLKNAVWAGYDDFDIDRLDGISKNDEIILYCSVGKRSEDITRKLQGLGYQNVKNMYGGIFEWVNEGRPVYNFKGKTENIHPFNAIWGVWLKQGEKTTGN